MKKEFSDFTKPSGVWKAFDINSENEFIKKIVTWGKFHKNVPAVIKEDYKLVERLQVYSFFDMALIDEAYGKSTRIFEASVDLKMQELGISKDGFEPLNSKIKRLKKYSSEELQVQWIKAKNMRNMFAHPKAGQKFGVLILDAFKHNINMINSVFLTKEEIVKREEELNALKQQSEHLKKGLFILTHKNTSYLIWSGLPYSLVNKNKSLWVFHEVYVRDEIDNKSGSINFSKPIIIEMTDVKIYENRLTGTELNTNEQVLLISADNSMNKEKYELQQKQMLEIDIGFKNVHWAMLEREISISIVNFLYEYSWD